MEHSYIYGTVRVNGDLLENLKTKGPTHTDLSGYINSVQEYKDSVVTDRCLIVEKYRSAEDDEGNCYDWYVIDKHYCYVDTASPVMEDIKETKKATEIAFVTLAEIGTIDGVTAGEHSAMFAEWAADVDYAAGNLRRYQDKLYRCISPHRSQASWTPDASHSLWVSVSDPAVEWPEWSQPVGAEDAYQKDDKVSHGGKHWTSDTDNNVWEPGVYGWTEASV